MSRFKKSYTAKEKAKIALEALKGLMTQAEITSKYGIHDTQIRRWKNQLKDNIANIFTDKISKQDAEKEVLIEELYKQIGQLKVELDWLKKNQHCSNNQKRACVNPTNKSVSIARQCELLELPLSTYYYKSQKVDLLMLKLMDLIDEEYTRHPFYGTRRMKHYLCQFGYEVNRKRIQNLYKIGSYAESVGKLP